MANPALGFGVPEFHENLPQPFPFPLPAADTGDLKGVFLSLGGKGFFLRCPLWALWKTASLLGLLVMLPQHFCMFTKGVLGIPLGFKSMANNGATRSGVGCSGD